MMLVFGVQVNRKVKNPGFNHWKFLTSYHVLFSALGVYPRSKIHFTDSILAGVPFVFQITSEN